MTEFGSFDNSTCKRVLDLLEPGDLRLGQVVIKRVAVVQLGVNNGSGDRWWKPFWYRGMDGYSEAGEYGNNKIWRDEIWSEKVRCSSNMKPRFRAE